MPGFAASYSSRIDGSGGDAVGVEIDEGDCATDCAVGRAARRRRAEAGAGAAAEADSGGGAGCGADGSTVGAGAEEVFCAPKTKTPGGKAATEPNGGGGDSGAEGKAP